MKRNVLMCLMAGVMVVGCGGGGGGSGGSGVGGNCSELTPVSSLCDLSCTEGSRSTKAEVDAWLTNLGWQVPPVMATDEYGGVEYQSYMIQCDQDGPTDRYSYSFWFYEGELAHIYPQGFGKYGYGQPEQRAVLPECANACNGFIMPPVP